MHCTTMHPRTLLAIHDWMHTMHPRTLLAITEWMHTLADWGHTCNARRCVPKNWNPYLDPITHPRLLRNLLPNTWPCLLLTHFYHANILPFSCMLNVAWQSPPFMPVLAWWVIRAISTLKSHSRVLMGYKLHYGPIHFLGQKNHLYFILTSSVILTDLVHHYSTSKLLNG